MGEGHHQEEEALVALEVAASYLEEVGEAYQVDREASPALGDLVDS